VLLEQGDENKLFEYLKHFEQKRLTERINHFWSYIKNA
jgi:hypothetical protein